jgi:hypothetical protein
MLESRCNLVHAGATSIMIDLPSVLPRRAGCGKVRQRPESEVRNICGGTLRTSDSKRTLEIYDSSVVLVRKFSWRTRSKNEENFRTTTLAVL